MNKRLPLLLLPDEALHNVFGRLGPVEYTRLAATCNDTRLVPKVQKTTDDINTIKRAMNNASTPCPTELILKYRPFAKGVFKDQLDDYIQSYINTKLPEEKKALFERLEEEPETNDEKTDLTRTIIQWISEHPLLVFATVTDGPWKGYTPLHWAAQKGHTDIVKALLQAGAEVDAKDEYGYTPLHWAAESGDLATVKALVTAGAEVNATVTAGLYKGCTPLHLATQHGKGSVTTLLIDNGANVNAQIILLLYWNSLKH